MLFRKHYYFVKGEYFLLTVEREGVKRNKSVVAILCVKVGSPKWCFYNLTMVRHQDSFSLVPYSFLTCCFVCNSHVGWSLSETFYVYFFFTSSRSFRGIIFLGEYLGGGGGKIPNLPKIHCTRSDGWAPTEIQYLSRSDFNLISLIPSRLAIGLYVPTWPWWIVVMMKREKLRV